MITVTSAAASKAVGLRDREESGSTLSLRIGVQPGGCSGLRYSLYFDDRSLEGDREWQVPVPEAESLTVRVDRMSAPYLQGATVDFVDSLEKQGFTIDNPNAAGGCACGDSFH